MAGFLFPMFLAALAGVSVVVQQVLNTSLRNAIESAAWAGFISYLGGLLFMAVLAVALRDPVPTMALAARAPWWAWTGGIFGAVFIAFSIYLVPILGAATFIALLVAGQMVASMVFDHFGWLGIPERPMDWSRLAGAALLVAGVVLIRR